MMSYLQGKRDYVYFINLDEYLFLAWNHQSSTWFFFSLYVQNFISVSTLCLVRGPWGGSSSLLLLVQVRELCVVVVV